MNKPYDNIDGAEEVLSFQSKKLALVAKAAKIGTWEYSFSTKKVVADEVMLSLYDLLSSQPTHLFATWMQVIFPGDRKMIRRRFLNLLEGSADEKFRFRIVKRDGSLRYMEAEATTCRDGSGRPVHLVGISRDVTEDKQSAGQVKETEKWYRQMFNQNLAGFYQATIDGVILNCSPAFVSMLKYNSADELVGTNIKDRFFSSSFFDHCIENLLSHSSSYSYEGSLLCKDGSPMFFLESLSMQEDGESGEKIINGTIIDITERQKDQQKLIATSIQLHHALNNIQKIMNSSLDVICSFDEQGRFLEVSAACEPIWGYKPEELKGRTYMELVYEEDKEKTVAIASEIMNGKLVTAFENRYLRKDGSVVPILWSSRWDGEDRRNYSIAKDATEKKRLEKAFEMERQRFQDLFFLAPSSIGKLKGPDHIFEMANPHFIKVYGKDDIIGKRVNDVFPETAEQGFIDILDTVYRTGKAFSAKEMLIRRDKTRTGKPQDIYLDIIFQPHRNSEDEIDGILFFLTEVTLQIIARKKIEDSERRYREIVETAQEGILQMDEDNRICFTNDKMCSITGYSYDEIMGNHIASFLGEEGEQLAMSLQKKHKEEGINQWDLTTTHKNGSELWIHISANPLYHSNGNYKGFLIMVTDVTESKKANLRNRFKADLLNTVGQAVMATDLAGNVIFWNKAAENLHGCTVEEAMGKPLIECAPNNLSKKEVAAITKQLMEGKLWSGELMFKKKSGEWFPALVADAPFYDANHKLAGIIGVVTDITQSKITEAKLKAQKEELQKANEQQLAILNALPPHIALLDSNGTIFSVNDSWKKYGRENGVENEESWVGYNYIEASEKATGADGVYGRKIAAKIRAIINGEINDFSMEYPCYTPYTKRWFKVVVSPLMNKVGVGAVVLHIDITDKMEADRKLRDQQEQLLASQKISQVGSWQINFQDSDDIELNCFLCSEVTYRIFGFKHSESEISYKDFERHVFADDRVMVKDLFRQAIAGTGNFSVDFRIVKTNGTMGWVHQEAKTIVEADTGKPMVMFGTVKDITANKEQQLIIEKNAQERQRMMNDLIQRNKDLEQFAYIVSHNLRLPLANILGIAEILSDDSISSQLKEELSNGLFLSVRKLDNVVQDLNEILKVKKQISERKEEVDFTRLLEDVKLSIKNLLDDNAVNITCDLLQVNTMITIKSYLHSIFYNLISNSIKYRRQDVPCLITIRSIQDSNNLQLIFSDNGTGIDLEKGGDEVFGLYKRFHNHVEGKGMGLFMVKTQVETLGGRISVKSKPNEGTTFLIEFPKYFN